MRNLSFIFLLSLILSSCIETPNSFDQLPPGKWRGYLKLTDPELNLFKASNNETEQITDYFELPFNFEVEYEGDNMHVYLLNGEERLKVDDVFIGRDPATAKDTLKFDFVAFDTKMEGFYEENTIEGYWKVPYKGNYSIPFIAEYGKTHRFNLKKVEAYDFDGDWEVLFNYDNPEGAYKAIGEFKQAGNNLEGTFRTETGDYRYLAGNAYENKLKLSVFDGSHAFLFSGNVQNDTIYGEFRSGSHYKTKWKAHKNLLNKSYLKDPYAMTATKDQSKANFSFQDVNGESVSLEDARYQDKIKLINIMGTWCPNCRDEINFLKDVKAKHPEVEVITIAFERYRDAKKAMDVLSKYKSKLDFDWPILLGGYADKKETAELLPFIDKIYSYPTLIMVDKQNVISDIHTGFNGPATSKYDAFEKEFYSKLNSLLN